MILEDQRYLHEDLERLEQAVADRIGDEPKQIRERLNRDHEICQLLNQVQSQSQALLRIYEDVDGSRAREMIQIAAGDPFEEFYAQLQHIRSHNARYPNEQAENSELRYRKRTRTDGVPSIVDQLFSGEEAFGRFFDLTLHHEAFANLPGVKRLSYLQYLEIFDNFSVTAGGLRRADKLTDQYLQYLGGLVDYLETFMRNTRPLENVDKVLSMFDTEFDLEWAADKVDGWELAPATGLAAGVKSSQGGVWCDACEKEYKNENVYKSHLSGKKHIKAAEHRQAIQQTPDNEAQSNSNHPTALRRKERAVAEREYRIQRLSRAMSTERGDTRVNVERKQGMTARERQQELENVLAQYSSADVLTANNAAGEDGDGDDDEEGDDKIFNPLKLPTGWDGKPIPFWLYRLHGLGVEFPCEICGNFVYMGRRAFDKHFTEARHVYRLRCLGIANTMLFRDITKIEQAQRLWEKIQLEKKKSKVEEGGVVQMEDGEGNVMPEKVYYDLQKQGLL